MKKYILSAFADEASPNISEQIVAMKKNGVSMLEARNVNGKNVSSLTVSEAKEVLSQLKSEGLSVWSIGSPVGKYKISDSFDAERERFLRVLDNAYAMEAKCIRLFSFFGVETGEQRDEALYRLSEFVSMANGSGVVLCHENEKGIYGDKAETCLDIHKSVPGLRAVFDPANFIQCGQDIMSAWETLSPYVYYMHAKDALENGSVVPVGYGLGCWDKIAPLYLEKGGEVISLEPHLRVFSGLSSLQDEELKTEYSYASAEEAFAASANAMKNILKNA